MNKEHQVAKSHLRSRSNTRKILAILRIAGAPLLLLIVMLRVDVGEIIAAFGHIKPLPLAIAASLLVANLFMLVMKWGYLLSWSTEVTTAAVIRSVIGGHAFVLVTPGHIGEFSRALFIPQESKLKIVGLVAIDKASSLGIILLMSSISLTLLKSGRFYLPAMGILGLMVLSAARPQLLKDCARRLSRVLPLRGRVSMFLEGIHTLNTRRVVMLLLISLFHYLVYSTQFCLLLVAFEAMALRVMVICVPLVTLVNSLPITAGGLGVREGAAVLLFTQFGVQGSSAMGAALLLFAINILIPGLCGLAFVHQIGSRPKPLMEKNP